MGREGKSAKKAARSHFFFEKGTKREKEREKIMKSE